MEIPTQPVRPAIKPDCNSATVSCLRQGLHQLVQYHGLAPAVLDHYQSLIEFSWRQAMASRQQASVPCSDHPWGWVPMLDTPDVLVGTLTVFHDQPIPLHDHPGSTGLLLVLRGEVQIASYQPADTPDHAPRSPLALVQTAHDILAPGQFAHFGPSENNIHGMQAIDDDCVLLDVLFAPYPLHRRAFYFPVSDALADGTLYVSRLAKPRGHTPDDISNQNQ